MKLRPNEILVIQTQSQQWSNQALKEIKKMKEEKSKEVKIVLAGGNNRSKRHITKIITQALLSYGVRVSGINKDDCLQAPHLGEDYRAAIKNIVEDEETLPVSKIEEAYNYYGKP